MISPQNTKLKIRGYDLRIRLEDFDWIEDPCIFCTGDHDGLVDDSSQRFSSTDSIQHDLIETLLQEDPSRRSIGKDRK